MKNKNNSLKAILQEKSAFLEDQSFSLIPNDQEGVAPEGADVSTCKKKATRSFYDPSKPQMESQNRMHVSVESVTLFDGRMPIITLKIESLFSGEIIYDEVSYLGFSPSTLKECVTKNGGFTYDWNYLYNVLVKEIGNCRINQFMILKGHIKLGWNKRKDSIVFYHQNMISSDDENSEYRGQVDIQPEGTLENIVGMINEWIISTPEWSPLEAIISFSVASVILPFAKAVWGKTMNNLVLHLVGNSSTGKSTSLRLHVGLASNPFNEKSGFWMNHQSSLAALIRRIGDNQGFPVSIDELSSAGKKEYDAFIYALGNGEEKTRLKAGGTAEHGSANFSTIVVSSGEVSILGKCSEKEGIRARCVELRNVNWTSSKEQADAVYNCLRGNYGWIYRFGQGVF